MGVAHGLSFSARPRSPSPRWKLIVAAGHRVLAVFTQPDRPKGRGGATDRLAR